MSYESIYPRTPVGTIEIKTLLVGRDGTLIARFGSRTTPDGPELIAAIEKALKPQ